MTRNIALLSISFVLACICGCKKSQSPAEANNPKETATVITLSYANFPTVTTFPCVQMERWKQEVEKRTGGKVKINTYPGGTLLDAKEMMDGVISGQADIGCLCMAYQPGRFMVTNATALPLGIPNAEVGSQVLLDIFNKYKPSEFSKVKVLAMFTTAPANVMSRKAVRKLEDLKGLDIRASGEAARILKAWGANQVGMPMSSTPEALQKGVIQGLFSSAEVMKDYKFAEQCKFITLTDTVIYPFSVVMNASKWETLPEDVKKVFEDLIAEQSLWTGVYMDKHVQDAVEWSKQEEQVETIELSAEEKAKFNALLEPSIQDWTEQAKKIQLPAEEIVADIKALVMKYSQAQGK